MYTEIEESCFVRQLKKHIERIIKESQDRSRTPYRTPEAKASLHGYIEAMAEILEYIEDNE